MSLKKFKPTTPGQRHKVATDFAELTKATPEKSLLAPMKKSGGRNNDGRMTMRYLGGGHKQRYRIVDFKREKFDIPATVKSIEYDPNRTANIALLFYADGEKRYIIAPNGLKVGDVILSGKTALPNVGHAMFLSDIPLGRPSPRRRRARRPRAAPTRRRRRRQRRRQRRRRRPRW